MQIGTIAEANPAVDSDIAMGNYLAPGTTALQAADNNGANPDSLRMDCQHIRSIEEQFDDNDGLMHLTSEQKLPSPKPLFLKMDTIELSSPRVSRS
jgi:hypothetical protein